MTVREFDINGLILRGLMADTETEWRDLIREYIAHHVKEDKSYLSDLDNAIKGMFSELRDKVRKGAETLKEQHTDLLKQSENGNPYGQAHPLGGISSEALEELRTKWRQTAERDTDNIKLPLPMQSGKPSGTEERIKFGELLTGETYSVEDLELLEKSYDSTCVNVLGKSEDISDTGEQLTGGVVSVEDLDLLLKRYTEAVNKVVGSASPLGGISSEGLIELQAKERQTAERNTDNINVPLLIQTGVVFEPTQIEILKSYFIPAFKGMGNNLDYFNENLLIDLQKKRTGKEWAMVAKLIKESSKVLPRVKEMTFAAWYREFCKLIGVAQNKYKPNSIQPTDAIKRELYYL